MPDEHPLLELQRIDSQSDALRAERDGLPEREALAERDSELATLAANREASRDRLVEVGREEHRIEAEVTELREQAKEVETTLYSGTVTAISELEGLQARLATLRESQSALEEQELALMEGQEALEDEIIASDARRAEVEREQEELRATLADGEARIDGLLGGVAKQREESLPRVGAPFLSVYEKLRGSERLRGVAATQLEKNMCSACRTQLPVTFVTRIRSGAADAVVKCQNCQRILVA